MGEDEDVPGERSLLLLIVWAASAAASAQDTAVSRTLQVQPDFYIGAYGGLAGVSHSGTIRPDFFATRTNFPNESIFTEGYGVGGSFGGLFELPLGPSFGSVSAPATSRAAHTDRELFEHR